MSFQAYLDNIHAKTGLGPEQFRDLAGRKGLLGADVRATEFTDWLKQDFDLGLGHARAIWKYFKDRGWTGTPSKSPAPGRSKP